MAKSAGGRSSDAALAECFRKAVAHKKARSPLTTKRGDLILMENRNQAMDLLKSDTARCQLHWRFVTITLAGEARVIGASGSLVG